MSWNSLERTSTVFQYKLGRTTTKEVLTKKKKTNKKGRAWFEVPPFLGCGKDWRLILNCWMILLTDLSPSPTHTYSLKIYIVEISTTWSWKGGWSKENVLAIQNACCSFTSNIDICLGASCCLGCPQTNLTKISLPRNRTCLNRKFHNHYHCLVPAFSLIIFFNKSI